MIRRTTCAFDCPDACSILAEVSDGTVQSLRGDPAHGVTRGFLCSQGRDWMKRVRSPDRLLHAMRRTKAGFERVSWDDALDTIAERLLAVKAELGPLAVLALRYSGMRGRVQKTLTRLFWSQFGGATVARGGMCVEAIDAALALDFGDRVRTAHPPDDVLNSRAVVLWGRNPVVTRPHLIPLLDRARKGGCRVIVIDPLRTPTARRADTHLAIRPGTDRLLAIGVARVLLDSDSYDHDYVAAHTNGFEAYRRQCLGVSLDDIARVTEVPLAAIEDLARTYGGDGPVASLVGLGVGSWAHGGEAVRAIDAIAALSGNIGVAGGGVSSDIEEVAGIDDVDLGFGYEGVTRSIRLPRLGEDMAAQTDPPLRFAWIAGANPVATAPDPESVARALRSLDFVVVVEQFMTATAAMADIVLPCATCFESDDLMTSYGHDWLGLTTKVLESIGEVKTDGEIYQELAQRLGFGDALAGDAAFWMRRLLGGLSGDGVTLESLQAGPVLNPRAPRVPLADGRFGTPSGKLELLQTFTPWQEPAPGTLPLLCTKTRRMVNLQGLSEDLADEPVVRVHPTTLGELGLADGIDAWVVSRVGRVRARVRSDDTLRRDVVLLNPATWKGEGARGVNVLREAILTDVGDCGAMHETRVRLEAPSRA